MAHPRPWGDYTDDASGLKLIPLNMAERVLVVQGATSSGPSIGVAWARFPHGSGNRWPRPSLSRGGVDTSELRFSQDNAAWVVDRIEARDLAETEDYIGP